MALHFFNQAGDPLPEELARTVRRRGRITIRRGTSEDVASIERLARLVDRRTPSGAVLLAEVDGVLLAALPLDGGAAVVDPFHATGDLVALLSLRAGQLAAAA
jgi:ketosteroid isomerase-like protein